MKRQPAKRSNLFLLELIIAILFFCLTSAVCVRFFVRSHIMEEDITCQNHAVSQSASVAELIRSDADLTTAVQTIYPEASCGSDVYTIGFDGEWENCPLPKAVYQLQLNYTEENSFAIGDIRVSAAGTDREIYHLSVKKYLQKEDTDS